MSELEKARCNRYQEIDYNKLIEELRVSYSDYANYMAECYRTGAKPGMKEGTAPAINTLGALNCFLNSTQFDSRELPLVVAGIGILLDNLTSFMDDSDKATADALRMGLARCITAVNVRFTERSKTEDA